MEEQPPPHSSSKGVYGDGEPPRRIVLEEDAGPVDVPVLPAADGYSSTYGILQLDPTDDGEDRYFWGRNMRARRRARLRAKVEEIIREIRTPLRDIVRDHVLSRLPVKSLLRFRSVSADWRRHISAPIFHHAQSSAHRSASGVFWQLPNFAGAPLVYASFDPLAGGIPDPSLSFLPGHQYGVVSIRASSNGLLCCAGPRLSYYVCNPSTAEWTSVPKPLHPAGAAADEVVLIFEPSAANLEANYRMVRPFPVSPDCEGLYGFQVFSSLTWDWQDSLDVCAAETLIPGSGVSAGGAACWCTTMQTAVVYDPATDRCRSVPWPMGHSLTARWQLGEMGRRLCCVCVTDTAVQVYALAAGDRWSLLASYRVLDEEEEEEEDGGGGGGKEAGVLFFRGRPCPLRFQSGGTEVLLWVDGRVVGLDVASGRMRVASSAPEMSSPSENYVPHISTFARVFPTMPSSYA